MVMGLQISGIVFALIAALIHVMIFFLESVLWRRPRTWRSFGLTSQHDAEVTQPLAFNQGFYNLFLAVGAGVGVILIAASGIAAAGYGVTVAALLSMVLASIVLISSSPKLARSAAIQGVAPLVSLVFLVLALAIASR